MKIELSNGWYGEAESFRSSPIVMVRLRRGNETRQFRIDLGKRIIIDAAPADIDAEELARVISHAYRG